MIDKLFAMTLSLCLMSATCSLAVPAPAQRPAIPISMGPPVPIEFPFYFQEKGIDSQGHGAFVGKATKMITLPGGRILYDGMVMINPKRPDTLMSVSVGPDVILPNGRKMGTLKFGSYQMLFDTHTETIGYMNAVVGLGDNEGHSLTLLYNQPDAIILPKVESNKVLQPAPAAH